MKYEITISTTIEVEADGAKKVINRWLFTDNDDVYQITDVQVRKGKGEK